MESLKYTEIEAMELASIMSKLIVSVINSKDHTLTQLEKENYLNHAWQLINKFLKDNKI